MIYMPNNQEPDTRLVTRTVVVLNTGTPLHIYGVDEVLGSVFDKTIGVLSSASANIAFALKEFAARARTGRSRRDPGNSDMLMPE